jgi:hypothetical protein
MMLLRKIPGFPSGPTILASKPDSLSVPVMAVAMAANPRRSEGDFMVASIAGDGKRIDQL